MALKLEQKKAVVSEVAEVAASAHSAVAAEYRGLSVEEMTQLRVQAREAGVYLRVVKNSLARRAIKGTEFQCMDQSMVGPLILGFSQHEPGAAARLVTDFSKDHKALVVKMGAVGGNLLDASQVPELAKMPTYDHALSSAHFAPTP